MLETIPNQQIVLFSDYDFDHPTAFDYDILFDTLVKLKQG